MEPKILECPNCGARNRVGTHSVGLRPICGRCGTALDKSDEDSNGRYSIHNRHTSLYVYILLLVLVGVVCSGIAVTPSLLKKDFSQLVLEETQKTEAMRKQQEKDLADRKATLENKLSAINAEELRRNAAEQYKRELEERKAYDKRFAISPREKAQLQMLNLASDSTKSFHDAIRAVAREASPQDSDISIYESDQGIALHIDFDMSSMTSGESGTQTKHHTKDSLRKEVISLISRVTNDIFHFSKALDLIFHSRRLPSPCANHLPERNYKR
jgi:ribosomal protein S27AE